LWPRPPAPRESLLGQLVKGLFGECAGDAGRVGPGTGGTGGTVHGPPLTPRKPVAMVDNQ
jgi:hypothetical protein